MIYLEFLIILFEFHFNHQNYKCKYYFVFLWKNRNWSTQTIIHRCANSVRYFSVLQLLTSCICCCFCYVRNHKRAISWRAYTDYRNQLTYLYLKGMVQQVGENVIRFVSLSVTLLSFVHIAGNTCVDKNLPFCVKPYDDTIDLLCCAVESRSEFPNFLCFSISFMSDMLHKWLAQIFSTSLRHLKKKRSSYLITRFRLHRFEELKKFSPSQSNS